MSDDTRTIDARLDVLADNAEEADEAARIIAETLIALDFVIRVEASALYRID